jgi:hypothetical protein
MATMTERVYFEVRTVWPDGKRSVETFDRKQTALDRMDLLAKDFVVRSINAELQVVYVCHIEQVIHSDRPI